MKEKKTKIKLQELKVKSFITNADRINKKTLVGGKGSTPACSAVVLSEVACTPAIAAAAESVLVVASLISAIFSVANSATTCPDCLPDTRSEVGEDCKPEPKPPINTKDYPCGRSHWSDCYCPM